jgi:electron transfer flavoprotein alpha subunit
MNMNSWSIISDERRVGSLLDAAKKLGGQTTAVVIGSRSLADSVADYGFNQVLLFETEMGFPAEAYGNQIADAAAEATPHVVLSTDAPTSRLVLGACGAKLHAAVISDICAIGVDGSDVAVSRTTADSKALEDLLVSGPLALIYVGEDAQSSGASALVEQQSTRIPDRTQRIIEIVEPVSSATSIHTATRIVAGGMGLGNKDNVRLLEKLADAAHAEIACTLPPCDDMRWFPSERVVGSSHNSISPELYIGVGISGQPQHCSGIRDAKVVVAINNDPENRFFKNCDYGILGNLEDIVPVLTAALKDRG